MFYLFRYGASGLNVVRRFPFFKFLAVRLQLFGRGLRCGRSVGVSSSSWGVQPVYEVRGFMGSGSNATEALFHWMVLLTWSHRY